MNLISINMKHYSICMIVLLLSCSRNNSTISIKGSDTEVNLAVVLAEQFHQVNASMVVSISGGGSGLGIAALLNGTADMANSSRSIRQEEIDLFHKQGVQIDSFIFAQDAVAIVVAEEMPMDSISTSALAKLFSGKDNNWLAITGKNMPVNIYGRQSNSGTHDFVKSKLGIEFSPNAKQMNGNAQILEAIRADHSGIGYVGAGYVSKGGGQGIKVLPVFVAGEGAVSPLNAEMIAEGKYFLQRPLFQYYQSTAYQKIKPFIDFEKSEAGKQIIHASGYYPVK